MDPRQAEHSSTCVYYGHESDPCGKCEMDMATCDEQMVADVARRIRAAMRAAGVEE